MSKDITIHHKIYHVMEKLGEGGNGVVHKIIGENLHLYALKHTECPESNSVWREACLREIFLLEKLKGKKNVIQLHDYEIGSEHVTMILELGEADLYDTLQEGSLSMPLVKPIWEQLLAAVAQIQEEGIVHGDLKPDNFVYVSGRLKVIDFGGSAQVIDKGLSHVKMDRFFGTLEYAAPESIASFEFSFASDIWALGIILYEMIYGSWVFMREDDTAIERERIEKEIISGDIAYPLIDTSYKYAEEIVKRCLQKDPSKRPTIHELLRYKTLDSKDLLRVKNIEHRRSRRSL